MVSLGTFHQIHNSDTLVPILISLQKWTPFFWQQDRIGMLVPLLTVLIRNPLLNLLAQDAIYISAALAAMYLLPRYMMRDPRYLLAGTLSAVAFLGLAPVGWFFGFTALTFYGVWLALGLGALVMTEAREDQPIRRWRWLTALGLLLLAHWVYSAAALLLGPLVFMRFLFCGPKTKSSPDQRLQDSLVMKGWKPTTWIRKLLKTEVASHMLLLGLGFALSLLFHYLATRHSTYRTNLSRLPASQWPNTWAHLFQNGWSSLEPHHWSYFLGGTAFAGLIQLGVPARRQRAGLALRAAIAVGTAATLYLLFMGTRQWMVLNNYNNRYTYPSLFLMQGALAILAMGHLPPAISRILSQRGHLLAAPGLLIAAFTSFDFPSVKTVHNDLDRTVGVRTADILDARCTHVAGSYWKVWPAVFHANMVLRDNGESRTVWGVTLRSESTCAQWQHLPLEDLRVAVPVDDGAPAEYWRLAFHVPADDLPEAENWLTAFHFPPMVVVEKRSTIYVLRPAAVVLLEQQGGLPPLR